MSDRLKRIKHNQDIDGIIASTFDAGWLIKVAEAAKALRDAEDDYRIKNCQSEYSLNKMEKMATKLDRLLGEE